MTPKEPHRAIPKAMTERPIIFSAPMVSAILEGRKTQTRRVVKRFALEWLTMQHGFNAEFVALPENRLCPYGDPGDRLWVRETWMPDAPSDGSWPDTSFYGCKGAPLSMIPEVYRKPEHCLFRSTWNSGDLVGWRSSIHMPRWASRITLGITGVRVERLQGISADDADAEGVDNLMCAAAVGRAPNRHHLLPAEIHGYAHMWEQIHGPGSWDANPWVWAIEFKRVAP